MALKIDPHQLKRLDWLAKLVDDAPSLERVPWRDGVELPDTGRLREVITSTWADSWSELSYDKRMLHRQPTVFSSFDSWGEPRLPALVEELARSFVKFIAGRDPKWFRRGPQPPIDAGRLWQPVVAGGRYPARVIVSHDPVHCRWRISIDSYMPEDVEL